MAQHDQYEAEEFNDNSVEVYNKYICLICGYIYDEAAGWPEDNIPAGTKWQDVPADWMCPDCGAKKEDFEMLEID